MGKKLMLGDIIKCCENRFNRGVAAEWKHSDFNALSFEIIRETGVNISPNTLKRIFGKIAVDDDYLPQQATLDALIKYGGYTENAIHEPLVVAENTVQNNAASVPKNKRLYFFIPLIIVAATVVFWGVKKWVLPTYHTGKIVLTTVEGVLPSTAFFDLQLPQTDDSIFVDFGDKSGMVYIKPMQQKITHNYLFPSVFDVKLLTRQQIIATAKVFVASNKWVGFGYHRQRDLPEHYYAFPALKTGSDSLFHIENSQLSKMGLDTNGSFFTRLCNFGSTGYSGDSFVFETSFKNDFMNRGIYCRGAQFKIAGMDGLVRFHLVNSGCSSKVLNIISEQTFEGSSNNLSQFVVDLDKWNAIKLVNKNKQVQLYVNDKLLFNGTYQKSIGEIKGVFVEFEGNGFVKQCNVKTPDGKTVYHF